MIDQFDILVTENNDDVTVNVTNNLEEVVDIFVAEAGEEIELNITNNIVELNIIRGAVNLSLTTNNNSGPATYDNITGVLNIPNYAPDLSGYVPYTGATESVNLGVHNITPAMVYISGAGTGGGGVLNIKKDTTRTIGGDDAANTISIWAEGTSFGFNDFVSGNVRSAMFSLASISNNLTRTFTLPNANGTLALTSDLHAAVTIGTANGLSLSGQQLSLGLASGSANGALSSTDWTTFNNKQNALTNPITGTGANGQVAFWNGTNTQTGDSGLVWDNVNKLLSLTRTGSTGPIYRLNVTSSSPSKFQFTQEFSVGVPTEIAFIQNQWGTGMTINSTQSLFFQAGANERMRIVNSSGNLLIGTTADAGFRLDVNGTARITSTLQTDADAVVNGVNIGRGAGNIASNTRVGNAALNANTTGAANTANGVGALQTNTTGFGNTANGWRSLQSNTIGGSNTAIGYQALVSNTTGFNNTVNGYQALFSNTTGGSNTADGHFALRDNTTGNNNTAIGQSAGRFIADGTTSNTITTNSIYIGFNTKALADNQTNQIVIGVNAIGLGSNTTVLGNASTLSTAIYGDLLLGQTTDNGTDRLQVTGTARVSSSITAGSFIRSGGTSAQYLMADGSVSTLSNPITGTGTTNFLPKFTGASTLGNSLIFDNGTNVGIGTTSPINYQVFGYGANIENRGGRGGGFVSTDAEGNNRMVMSVDGSAVVGQIKTVSNTPLVFGVNDAERMRITSSGNVGIGTTSPVRPLDVNGSMAWGATTGAFMYAGGTSHLFAYSASNINLLFSGGSGGFGVNNAADSVRLLQILDNGNVGIGTTSPSERLTVSGNVLATAFFTSSDITLKNIIKTNYNPTGIEAISYKWKDSGIDTKVHIGYSAQQVQEFMPDAVSKDSNGKLSVNYVEVLVAKIAALEAEVKLLKAN